MMDDDHCASLTNMPTNINSQETSQFKHTDNMANRLALQAPIGRIIV
jgi:hypothetical protein